MESCTCVTMEELIVARILESFEKRAECSIDTQFRVTLCEEVVYCLRFGKEARVDSVYSAELFHAEIFHAIDFMYKLQ